MRIQADIIADGTLIFFRFSGHQTTAMGVDALQHIHNHPGYSPDISELIDLSSVTSNDLDFNGMRKLARIAGGNGGLGKQIALFAPQDVEYGMARMFCTLLEMEPTKAKAMVFRDPDQTLRWLGRSEKSFADLPGYNDMAIMPTPRA